MRPLAFACILALATSCQAAPPGPDPVAAGVLDPARLAALGPTLVEVSRQTSPATATLSPRLARQAARRPGLRHLYLEAGPWDGPRARAMDLRAVPAFFLYEGGQLRARGADALASFRRRVSTTPPRPAGPRSSSPILLAGSPQAPAAG